MKHSNFRGWINNLWLAHRDEILQWTKKPCEEEAKDWFTRNKYWLKETYKNIKK